jgi:hypothetical protein
MAAKNQITAGDLRLEKMNDAIASLESGALLRNIITFQPSLRVGIKEKGRG